MNQQQGGHGRGRAMRVEGQRAWAVTARDMQHAACRRQCSRHESSALWQSSASGRAVSDGVPESLAAHDSVLQSGLAGATPASRSIIRKTADAPHPCLPGHAGSRHGASACPDSARSAALAGSAATTTGNGAARRCNGAGSDDRPAGRDAVEGTPDRRQALHDQGDAGARGAVHPGREATRATGISRGSRWAGGPPITLPMCDHRQLLNGRWPVLPLPARHRPRRVGCVAKLAQECGGRLA